MRLHAIDVAADDLVVLAEADLVVLAAPVRQNIELLEELDENVRQPAIITDTGSTKRESSRRRRSCRHASRSSAGTRWRARRRAGSSARARISSKAGPGF